MKRIKSLNGYTIYQATERDAIIEALEPGYFYGYFSSDIRDYGRAYSYIEFEAATLEEAEDWARGSNYATAREYVEANTTAATFEEIEAVEKMLDQGLTADDIAAAEEAAEEAAETVHAVQINNLFYVMCPGNVLHGAYFTLEAADTAAQNYANNTGCEYVPANK